jgi:hypothetical protein
MVRFRRARDTGLHLNLKVFSAGVRKNESGKGETRGAFKLGLGERVGVEARTPAIDTKWWQGFFGGK